MKFFIRPTRRNILVLLLIGSLLAAIIGKRVSSPLRSAVQWALTPVGDAGMYLTTSFKKSVSSGSGPITLEEVERLMAVKEEWRSRALEAERNLARRIRREKLKRNLFGKKHDIPVRLIYARVVMGDSMPYNWTRVVNAGSTSDVKPGCRVTTRRLLTDRSKALPKNLAVLWRSALVGRIIRAGAFTATCQLVTDRGYKSDAVIIRKIDADNPRRIKVEIRDGAAFETISNKNNKPVEVKIQGDGTGRIIAPEIKAGHNIRPGDLVKTRQDNEFLPQSILVGQVVRVEDDREDPGFETAYIRPAANLAALREVFVVVPQSTEPK